MARATSEDIPGAAELIAALRRRGQFASGQAIRKALRAGGRVLLDAEIERCPELKDEIPGSTALPPGALKEGLRMYSRDYNGTPQVVVGPNAKTAHVAAFVELGHALVEGRGKDAKVIGEVPAHPWLRPAYESSIDGVKEAIVDSMRASLKDGGSNA